MPTNFSDALAIDALGIQGWILIIVAAVWYQRRYRRLVAVNGAAPIVAIHRVLGRYDNAGYAVLSAYLLSGLCFASRFAVHAGLKCSAIDCSFAFARTIERIILWPYYAWFGLI